MQGVLLFPKMAMKSKRHEVPNSLFSLASGFPLCIINLLSFRESQVLRLTHFYQPSSLRIISSYFNEVFFYILF